MTSMNGATGATPVLDVSGLGHTYGAGPTAKTAISDITFVVHKSEIVSIVGPSGCGKTTLLRSIAGLQRPTQGSVSLNGKKIDGVTPAGMAMVFQDYSRSLFPWMKVGQNVDFPLQPLGLKKEQRTARVRNALGAVGLSDYIDFYPWQMSGGMQQRAAIARALALEPEILIMDEPFASVDAQTRSELEDLVLKIQAELDTTVLFVTHDIDESVYLADRVVTLSKSPSVVTKLIEVELPRPRDQVETKADPSFVENRRLVAEQIRISGLPTAAVRIA